MWVGLAVKGDAHEIEQCYSKVSSINLEMAGLIGLSALVLVKNALDFLGKESNF